MKILLFLLLISPVLAHAAMFDMGEHSGIIKDSTGNYYRVNPAGTVSAIKTGTDLVVTEKINIPTSKGSFAVDLARNVSADIPRMGKAVRTVALAGGPIGMAISAVSLICELTTICNVGGVWQTSDAMTNEAKGQTAEQTVGTWTIANQTKTNVNLLQAVQQIYNPPSGWYLSHHVITGETSNSFTDTFKIRTSTGGYYAEGVAATYSGTYSFTSPQRLATVSDWDAKESLMNDARFIDPLMEKNQPVPVGIPTITTPQQVPLSSETKTLKDGAGNVTGTETTTTEAVISQPSAAENPTGSPTIIKVLENSTVNNYNTSNQLTSSTTTVSSNTPPAPPQAITISIDNVPDVPLQTVAVPGTFSFTSWGSGSCPADKTWTTMFGTHQFSYQLTCDFAGMAKPIILLIAAIVSIMIVASIRTDT